MRAYCAASMRAVPRLCLLGVACLLVPRVVRSTTTSVQIEAVCGDGVISGTEICDDGNQVAQDGCAASCRLETGYMCYNSMRNDNEPTSDGRTLSWNTSTGNSGSSVSSIMEDGSTFAVLSSAERCAGTDICISDLWQADLWRSMYDVNADNSAVFMPPSGYYCARFCKDKITPPPGYEFKDGCHPTVIAQCLRGLTNCDANAFCLQTAGAASYTCRCDPDFFVSASQGTACARSGIELLVNFTGSASVNENEARNAMNVAREALMRVLLARGYVLSHKSNVSLLLEGVLDYPVELVESQMQSPLLAGGSMWRVVLRIPSQHIDTAKFGAGVYFNDFAGLSGLFVSPEYAVHETFRCNGQQGESVCTVDSDCASSTGMTTNANASAGTCTRVPDATVRFLSAGGHSSPLAVSASGSGSSIMSVEYDSSYAAFKIRVRYVRHVCMRVNASKHHVYLHKHIDIQK